MSWGKRKSGWSDDDEGEVRYSFNVSGIVKGILEVVPGGVLRAGKRAYADDARVGFWLGVDTDGLAKLNLGGATSYLKWTGARLDIAGGLRTKNGYVQIVDESSEAYGEGIRLLIEDWLTSGSLRWDDAQGRMGAVLAASRNGSDSTHLALNVYPRVSGPGRTATYEVAVFAKAHDQGGTSSGIAITSEGSVWLRGNLLLSLQKDNEPGVTVYTAAARTADLVQVIDENEEEKFALGADGSLRLGPQAAHRVFAGPASGAAARPAFRALVGADLPSATESASGGVELATQAEQEAGISTAVVNRPAYNALRKIGDGWALGTGGNARGSGRV